MLAKIQRGVAPISKSKSKGEAAYLAWLGANYDELMADEPDYDWGPSGPPRGTAHKA